ncbi:MAG TPA: ester cyclase [Solirubrobacterales bacterium]|nr:ester cyclase [Solirubrobacterales bacterium]
MAKADPETSELMTADVARGYFDAVAARDPQAIAGWYEPGSIDRLVGMAALRAPDEVREWFAALFAAVPDFSFEVLDLVAGGDKAAVRWRSRGTFNGTGKFEGIAPTGASLDVEGFDLLTVADAKVTSNHAYINGMDMARQMGVMPPAGSLADRAMLAATNARIAAAARVRGMFGR